MRQVTPGLSFPKWNQPIITPYFLFLSILSFVCISTGFSETKGPIQTQKVLDQVDRCIENRLYNKAYVLLSTIDTADWDTLVAAQKASLRKSLTGSILTYLDRLIDSNQQEIDHLTLGLSESTRLKNSACPCMRLQGLRTRNQEALLLRAQRSSRSLHELVELERDPLKHSIKVRTCEVRGAGSLRA